MRRVLLAVAVTAASCGLRAHPVSAPPPDRPVHVTTSSARDDLFEAIKPYVAQARATYPKAKERFVKGLPEGCVFFLTVRLTDSQNRFEQVFVRVDKIEGGRVSGRIWNDIQTVSGFSNGQALVFSEEELLDWVITHPDGSEEGNYVGKFLDERQDRVN